MKNHKIYRIMMLLLVLASVIEAKSFSLALDSVAEWGKFPRFCVNTYRWGDRFFNGYDTDYVVGTGYKFNTKVKLDSWVNSYQFYLPDNVRMSMRTEPSTSTGLWLTYLAVSAGYDKNISRFFGNPDKKTRELYYFGFNCSLFAFNMSYEHNTGGVTIKRFGPLGKLTHPNIEFNGLESTLFGADVYYFFNHKKYSQAAAFSFSRIQTKSQGSWFAGLSYYNQKFNFDFNTLPSYMQDALPDTWYEHRYHANTKNYAIKFGYGYNWVFAPKWLLAVSESPTIGIKKGIINNPDKESTNINLANQLKIAVTWNHKQWFAGLVGSMDMVILYDKGGTIQNSYLNATLSVGYRFNIWEKG